MKEEKKALQTKRLTPAWETRLSDCVVALEWAANGEVLAVATIDGKISIIPKKGGDVLTISAHANGMGTLAWHPDQELLISAGQDGFVRAWHANGEKVWEYQAGKSWLEKLAWSSQPVKANGKEEKVLAVASGKEVLLLNAEGQLIAKSEALDTTITDLCWYPNGAMVLAAAYGGLYVFHGATAKQLRNYQWKGAMWNCHWSPDGRWVCGGSQENAVHIWDANSGEHLHMPGYQAKIRTLDWNHTGHWLATGNGMDVLLWDCSGKGPNGRAPQMFGAHSQSVTEIRFRHGGDVFAAGGKDGNLMLWDANGAPEPLAAFIGGVEIGPVRWSPDDKLVAVGTADGDVLIF